MGKSGDLTDCAGRLQDEALESVVGGKAQSQNRILGDDETRSGQGGNVTGPKGEDPGAAKRVSFSLQKAATGPLGRAKAAASSVHS